MTQGPTPKNPGQASLPERARDEDVRSVFQKALQGKIGFEAVTAFVQGAAVGPERCLSALREAMHGGISISSRTLGMLERSLPIFESALATANTEAERALIRAQILDMLRESRAESRENRRFLKYLAGVAGGAAALAVGAVVLLAKHARSRRAPLVITRP